ncbi:hypothetical protein Tco_0786989 [Tanacetum coccineum]
MDVDDEISNLVDLHMGMFDGGWKWQDLQGLLWLDHHKSDEGGRGGETVIVVAWLRWPRCADDGVGGDGVVRIVAVVAADKYGYIKNHKKTVKNGQARTRESEEYKKKPKNLSLSQKQSKDGQTKSTQKDKSSKYFTLVPQLSQKSKNVPSSLIGPRKAYWA